MRTPHLRRAAPRRCGRALAGCATLGRQVFEQPVVTSRT
jgi:hypothetical protein